jgi:L-iditol 2-dehydrogenase
VTRTRRVAYLTGPERIELREELVRPPGAGELLLRVDAATTCGTDVKVYRRGGHPRMLSVPCPFGHEVSGTVVEVGGGTAGWREGDEVVVVNSAPCGDCEMCAAGRENLCSDLRYLNGAYADHVLIPARFVERSVYRRPAGLDPAVAALAEPLACVHHGLEVCGLTAPTEVVVIGAGPIGLMFVSELAAAGHRVVSADLDAGRLATALGVGAAATVHAAGDAVDGVRLLESTADELGAPLVVEATGAPAAWRSALEAVRCGGTVVLFGGCPPASVVPLDAHRVHYGELTVKGVYHHRPKTVVSALGRLAEAPPSLVGLIEEEYPLEHVETALRRMASREILKAAVLPRR